MSVSALLGNPKPQFFISGLPAVGYRLFFYAATTSTKQDTYTDSTATIVNSNPIVLDAEGYPTGNVMIYGTDNLAYKVILAPPGSDDPPTSTTWTIDKIYTTASGIIQAGTTVINYTATTGQTLFTLPPGTAYGLGNNSLEVYLGSGAAGGRLRLTEGQDYTETSTTSFTLSYGAVAGDRITIVIGQVLASPSTLAASSVILASGDSLQDIIGNLNINIKDAPYSAVGDGVTDDTAAIQAAYDAAQALKIAIARFTLANGKDSSLNTSTGPAVIWPSGKYLLTSPINMYDGIKSIAHRAYVFTESLTNELFLCGLYNVEISGFIFDGGKYHIKLYSAIRTESSWVHIHNCQFRFAQTRCIFMDRSGIAPITGFPMTLQINNIKSYGSPFLEAYTNGTFVSDSWIAWDTSTANHDGGALFICYDKFNLFNILEVPYNTNSNFYPRLQVQSGDPAFVTCINCRFGGETTATPLIVSAGSPTSFIFDNCALYGVASQYWARFDTCPDQLIIRNDLSSDTARSFENTFGIWFNSATITSISDIPNFTIFDIDTRTSFTNAERCTYSADYTISYGASFNLVRPKLPEHIPLCLRNYDVGDGRTWWGGSYSLSSSFWGFNGTVTEFGYTFGYGTFSNNGYAGINFPSFVAPAAGMMTFHCMIKCTETTQSIFNADTTGATTISSQFTKQTLYSGWNHFKATFYHDGVTTTQPRILIVGNSGNTITIGMFAFNIGSQAAIWQPPILTGERNFANWYNSAAPVSGTWFLGDKVYNTTPSVDGNNMVLDHWVCTVAGTPGTWVPQYLSTVSPAT